MMNLQVSITLGSLQSYVHAVNAIPMLSQEREQELFQKLQGDSDVEAARGVGRRGDVQDLALVCGAAPLGTDERVGHRHEALAVVAGQDPCRGDRLTEVDPGTITVLAQYPA